MKKALKEYLNESEITLVTHGGVCHADDMLAAALLTLYFEEKDIEVKLLRTRDEGKVPENSIVFDVFGGELDHHGKEAIIDGGRELASIGLIWRWGKEEFIKTFELDETTWSEIDRELFKPVDETDNTGKMNPFNWIHNCIRNYRGIEKVLKWHKRILRGVFFAMAEKAEQQRKYLQLNIKEIAGITCRYSESFLPSGIEDNKAVQAFVWKNEKGHYMVRTLNGLQLKPGITTGEIPGVIFTHKGGWIGEVESLEDIKKILA